MYTPHHQLQCSFFSLSLCHKTLDTRLHPACTLFFTSRMQCQMLWWYININWYLKKRKKRLPLHSAVCFVAQFLLNFHVNFVLESSFVSDLCLSKPPDSRFVSHICISKLCCGPSPLLSSCAASLCLVAARRWWCWSWCHHRLPASLAQLHRHFPCVQTAWRTDWRPAVGASRTHPPVYPCGTPLLPPPHSKSPTLF